MYFCYIHDENNFQYNFAIPTLPIYGPPWFYPTSSIETRVYRLPQTLGCTGAAEALNAKFPVAGDIQHVVQYPAPTSNAPSPRSNSSFSSSLAIYSRESITSILTFTTKMPAYCAPCKKSFKEERALDQHIRDSPAHKVPNQIPSQVQELPQAKSPPIALKQQEQALPSRVKPIKPQQALSAGSRIHISTERNNRQPPVSMTSSSSTPQITIPVVEAAPQDVETPWSVVADSEFLEVLNSLSAHCHSLEDLKKNDYIVSPYNPLDYVNSRKCKRCNRKFLVLIMELSWIDIGPETKVAGRECRFHLGKRNASVCVIA